MLISKLQNFKKIITSESVGIGHPDKICDQISDNVLDKCLKQDKYSKVACEVFAANRLIVIGGEIKTKGYVDVVKSAWEVLFPLGYNESDFTIVSNVNTQSEEINKTVNKPNKEIGAGDQGIVFGYATNECENFMPLSLNVAHEILKITEEHKRINKIDFIKWDMKSQVSLNVTNKYKPLVDTIVFSIQHKKNTKKEDLENFCNYIIDKALDKFKLNKNCKRLINPSGQFTIGGPMGDTGLTGRKIIVDTYGCNAKHGGGSFSGKDASKVDRSGAYFARYIAKNLVASGLAAKCEVQLSFAIGHTKPISINIDTFNTSKLKDSQILEIINKVFNFSIKNFIEKFNMLSPIYLPLSKYGHFGRYELECGWEKLDMVKKIQHELKKMGL